MNVATGGDLHLHV